MRLPDLEGKVAIVTGSASGIGKATALFLGTQGVAIAVADIDEAGAEQAVECRGFPGEEVHEGASAPRAVRRGETRFSHTVVAAHIVPARGARRNKAVSRYEFAGLFIDDRDREIREDAHPVLMDTASPAAHEKLFFPHQPEH